MAFYRTIPVEYVTAAGIQLHTLRKTGKQLHRRSGGMPLKVESSAVKRALPEMEDLRE